MSFRPNPSIICLSGEHWEVFTNNRPRKSAWDKKIPSWENTRLWHLFRKSKRSSKIKNPNQNRRTLFHLFHLNSRILISLWYYKFHNQNRLQGRKAPNKVFLKIRMYKRLIRTKTSSNKTHNLQKNKKASDLYLSFWINFLKNLINFTSIESNNENFLLNGLKECGICFHQIIFYQFN